MLMLKIMLIVIKTKERGDAEELAKKVRVLCWVMTGPDNHKTKVALIILVILVNGMELA